MSSFFDGESSGNGPEPTHHHFITFLEVGRYLLLDICKAWMGVEEICLLDTAHTNHRSRLKFTSYFSSKIVCFHGLRQGLNVTDSFMRWIHVKNLEIDSMVLNNDIIHSTKEFLHLD